MVENICKILSLDFAYLIYTFTFILFLFLTAVKIYL
jgi:hypothetical protein